MAVHIALLRGINVGGHRKIAMPALRELLESLGYEDVQTYLQSGNVVLRSPLRPKALAEALEQEILDGLGVDPRVVVRSADEMADVVARNPWPEHVGEPKKLQVNFLEAKPAKAAAPKLEAADIAPEEVVLSGREVFSWHPDGLQRSKLGPLLSEKRLGVAATGRNWNTVTKLLELAGG